MERKLAKQFQIAKKAAHCVSLKGVLASRDEESRCVHALSQLKTLPVTSRLLASSGIVKPLQNLTHHRSKKIRSNANCLLQTWQPVIARTNMEKLKPVNSTIKKQLLASSKQPPAMIRSSSTTYSHGASRDHTRKNVDSHTRSRSSTFAADIEKLKPVKEIIRCSSTAYCDVTASRDNVRELLVEAFRKVAGEVSGGDKDSEMMRRKLSNRDPVEVAASVERVLFEKLGIFNGDVEASFIDQFRKKMKYKLIMCAMNDPKNPNLRRKVLAGEISPKKLVDMKAAEMTENRRLPETNKKVLNGTAPLIRYIWRPLEVCMHVIFSS